MSPRWGLAVFNERSYTHAAPPALVAGPMEVDAVGQKASRALPGLLPKDASQADE